ncbi:hypothetical protein ACFFMN_31295 [Planobispora siamensis]|uniref:Integrase n=1 Tax=Planobispora siamensis TaxID=936338 RepID=A0A8J3SH51_9ACTN|nr:hypothetical protein [Planobispora siamensis]GIH92862.1 hypothetical protein Psi01_34920 [Planobispora siamensis]
MSKRRSRGDGGLHWDERRQRWLADKALTLAQAEAVPMTAENSRMHAYIVVSLLTGARTEELRH